MTARGGRRPRSQVMWAQQSLAWLIVTALLVVAADAFAGPDTHHKKSRAGERRQPVFRLGSAAAPFGWATKIADFNRDGKPDVAVADRVSRRGNRYRLDVSVSGQRRQRISFVSAQSA